MKLAIYAGHGGSDPGAVNGNMKEKDYTLLITTNILSMLKQYNVTTNTNRTTDKDSYIADKVFASNDIGVDATIEIHLNAGGGTGCETYYSYNGMGKSLAEKICSNISSQCGYRNRGAKIKKRADGRDYFGIIRDTDKQCVLVECCFLDCNEDIATFSSTKLSKAIVDAIVAEFKLTKKETAKPTNDKLYRVQTGAFANRENAEKYVQELRAKGIESFVKE